MRRKNEPDLANISFQISRYYKEHYPKNRLHSGRAATKWNGVSKNQTDYFSSNMEVLVIRFLRIRVHGCIFFF